MRNLRTILFPLALAIASVIGGCEKKADPVQNGNAVAQGAQPAAAQTQAQAPAAAPASSIQPKLPGSTIVTTGDEITIAYILWGGDMPTFYGNGGLETRTGTTFAEYNLHVKLFAGDDTPSQIKSYLEGKTQFLRMTAPTLARYLPQLCPTPDADTCPEYAFQMTWSAGDHLECRDKIMDIKQLKNATVALQKAGPHESFVFDILRDAGLKLSDVKIRWTTKIATDDPKNPELGDSAPALMRRDATVDCAFAISPDLVLSKGLTGKGDGAEGSIKNAHVLVSTADRRKSIPDVYYVSHGYNQKHGDVVRRFAAAYLKSVEKVTALRHDYEDKTKGSEELRNLLAFSMQVNDDWKAACPSESDTFGLLQDASFVGLAGNVEWLTDANNATGMKYFSDLTNDLAAALAEMEGRPVPSRVDIQSAKVDWSHAVFSGLVSGSAKRTAHFNTEATAAEIEKLNQTGAIAGNRITSFVAYFDDNQVDFDESKYQKEFDETIKIASKYSRVPIVIRGHTDTTLLVATILKKGIATGIVKQAGSPGNYSYSIDGKPLDLQNAKQVLAVMSQPGIDDARKDSDPAVSATSPSRIAEAATALSKDRANQVKNALLAYAVKKGVKLDESQVQVVGAGANDPFIVKPRSAEEAAKNRRVEFSLVRVSAEAATSADYEL